MRDYLLTGASGFLGARIIELLGRKNITTIGRNRINDIICDLTEEIPDIPPHKVIVHAAGLAHFIPKTEQERQSFFHVNVDGSLNLMHAIEKSGQLPNSFIFISSVSVYGLQSGKMIKENAPLLATDPYGLSKIHAEEIIREWGKRNSVKVTILRLPLLIGEDAPGNLKSMVNGIKKGYYFNVGGGRARKSMVMVDDVAAIIPKAAAIEGIYNLSDNSHPSFLELSNKISSYLGKPKPLNLPMWFAKCLAIVGDRVGLNFPINSYKLEKLTSELTFNNSRAGEILGWKPTNVLQQIKI